MSDIYIAVGNRIRELRRSFAGRGMSQAEMGRATGVPANTISRWETGIYKPNLGDLDMLAQFFGVPISRMLPEPTLTPHALDLMNVIDGLTKEDTQEVINFALFKRATAKRRVQRQGEGHTSTHPRKKQL